MSPAGSLCQLVVPSILRAVHCLPPVFGLPAGQNVVIFQFISFCRTEPEKCTLLSEPPRLHARHMVRVFHRDGTARCPALPARSSASAPKSAEVSALVQQVHVDCGRARRCAVGPTIQKSITNSINMNSNQICQHRAPCTGEPVASTKGMFVRALHVVFPIPFFYFCPFFPVCC